jgi:uncharacterized protein (DUF58 family)
MSSAARLTRLTGVFTRRRTPAPDDPFDPRVFARLDRLRFRFTRAYGARSGETMVRGLTQDSGIEVESFKTYTPGDDIRYVDWNAVGRLDQLLTRRFVAEREIPVHVLLDASASMAVPVDDRKFAFAVRLAAALAYVALNANDPVRVAAFRLGADGVQVDESPLLRHRGRYLNLKPYFAGLEPSGATGLLEGVSHYLERHRERGVAFVLSDFLVPHERYVSAMDRLRARGLETHAIQVVGAEERAVSRLGGRLRLRDAESGAVRDVMLSSSERRRYGATFAERIERVRSFCHRSAIGHALVSTSDPVERCLTTILPAAGLLRLK